MTKEECANIMRRMIAMWPKKDPPTQDEQREWAEFLKPMNGDIALQALVSLRDTLKFRPTMSDFKQAYHLALEFPKNTRTALPGGKKYDESLLDLYGGDKSRWVYCWKCNMAITLCERDDDAVYEESRGLSHSVCPKTGSRPVIPTDQKILRDEWFSERGISLGGSR